MVKKKIDQYPNCEQLIWQVALILDAWRLTKKVPDSENMKIISTVAMKEH